MSTKPVCLIIQPAGAGPGILGLSFASKWAANGYQVVIVRSDGSKVDDPDIVAIEADATDQERMEVVVDEVESKYGPVKTMIYDHIEAWIQENYEEVSVEELENQFSAAVTGLLIAAKIVCPRMVEAGGGVVGITGATASLRGKPGTIGFAPAKAAQRIMAQSLARDLGPQNVHVFYAIIDGTVKVGAEEREKHMDPEDIAETYWSVAQQKRSAWTHEVDMRPFCEKW